MLPQSFLIGLCIWMYASSPSEAKKSARDAVDVCDWIISQDQSLFEIPWKGNNVEKVNDIWDVYKFTNPALSYYIPSMTLQCMADKKAEMIGLRILREEEQ